MPHDKTIKNKTKWNVFCWAWLRSCSNDYLDTLITRQYIVPLKNIVWIQVTKPWRPLLWLVFPSILAELWMIAYNKGHQYNNSNHNWDADWTFNSESAPLDETGSIEMTLDLTSHLLQPSKERGGLGRMGEVKGWEGNYWWVNYDPWAYSV
jgi:hypothetical protein